MSSVRDCAVVLSFILLLAGCSVPSFEEVTEPYAARKDTVTLGAGEAQRINEAIHTIDPAPPSAFDTQIPANGQRMAGAVERYRDVSKLPQAPRQIVPTYGGSSGTAGSSDYGAAGTSPAANINLGAATGGNGVGGGQ
jgi:hypothetical protein